MKGLVYRYRYYALWLLFAATLIVSWPGFIQPDSSGQYVQAVSGLYTDHHPPFMSFVWHYLDKIYKGEGLVYTLQVLFIYSAVTMLMLTVDRFPNKEKKSWMYILLLLFPIYPQVLIYLLNIVKDVQFATSFLLVSSILAYYTIVNKRPSIIGLISILIILTYGSAVKYQGQFLAIIPAIWLGSLLLKEYKIWKKILAGLAIYGMVYGAITSINNILVPQKSKNNSWQLVKLYDLAAISIGANVDLIPTYNKTHYFSYDKLVSRFKYPSVDEYVFVSDSILTKTKSEDGMVALQTAWRKAIFAHPVLYLKHRAINISYALFSRPGYQYAEKILVKIPQDSVLYIPIYYSTGALFYAFMCHFPVLLLGGLYFVLSLCRWKNSQSAKVLLGMSSTALLMVGILFFMSMAGTPRYTYVSILLIHASHVFAYACYKERKIK